MTPEQIILHHSLTADSGTVSWTAIREYHKNVLGWKDVGYHFGIEKVNGYYETIVGRNLFMQGAHCRGQNHNSIGVCFVGNFDRHEPPHEQWATGLILVSQLRKIFQIPREKVLGHNHYSQKTCPGIFFDVKKFRNQL